MLLRKRDIKCDTMTTGFFKVSESLERCGARLDRFEEISFGRFISDQNKPQRYKLKVVYLYASKSQKRYRTFQPAKGILTQVNKDITTFDRFLVLGIPQSPHVVISFLKTPAATKNVLRFSSSISPGDELFVIMPQINSYLGPQNPEISTFDPLIPIATSVTLPNAVLPPTDVDAPNYTWFDFISKSIKVFTATAQDNVCTGTFCDAQTVVATCPCTCADSQKHWALALTFTCEEFNDIARTQISLVSKRSSRVFISVEKLAWPLTNDSIDQFELDDAVGTSIVCLNFVAL